MKLSAERVAEIHRLWRELQSMTKVARAAGCTKETALRYLPDDVVRKRKVRSCAELRKQIENLWRELKSCGLVARAAKVDPSTARRYRPHDVDKPLSNTGYGMWNEDLRRRWDRHWNNPDDTHYDQLAKIITGQMEE